MSDRVFRSPRTVSAAGAIIPARLAQQYARVLWRELPGGEIEVATRDGARVERLRVHHDGSTTPAGTSTHRPRKLQMMGFAVVAVGAATVALAARSTLSRGGWLIVAFGLLVAAAVVYDLAEDLASHLDDELGAEYEWHEPTDLHGWTPQTTAQLTAVEKIATGHGGVAHVANLGLPTIEVRTDADVYVLDETGQVQLHERKKLFQRSPRTDGPDWIEIRTRISDN